ncbi:hypothetical protein PROFUN_08484 [Planoprotostelium fungivorum]|uniref:Mediator of RNA polymerase II transcription subunit 4 n=1 Tax=Planoprotostelium fungivorum TaxID=1890364 RepID=A0A2P6N1Z4_9EUKA|nr:hypothetical protein PROFUN_08484 [Planoprotostelium fungivorum]
MANTIRAQLHEILDEYSKLTLQIFSELSSGQAAAATDLMGKLIEKDKELNNAVKELKKHQEFQMKINQTIKDIEEKDKKITQVMQILRDAESILSAQVEEGRKQLKIREQSKQSAPFVDELVSYSHRISATTSAPPGWSDGQETFLYKFPAPMETEIRSGMLYSKEAEDLFKT